jgi:hypothetical protein
MSRRLLFFDFPEGVDTVYVDGKQYTHSKFLLAQSRERRRLKNGRFSYKDSVKL